MTENNKPHTFSMGSDNPADGESVSAANNTHSIRPSSKYVLRRRDSLPYQTKYISDSGFLASKNCADEHLKRNGLNPVWSIDDVKRERAIKWAKYCETIYESRVANA